jgi:CPA2 family monovalent cation:H+ antiporter-2
VPHNGVLQDLVLIYGVAIALIVLAGRVGVPSIVALVLTGIITGPSGFGAVETKSEVDLLAEIGIALLLFMAGLDFSIAGLRQTWRGIVIGGTLQVVITAAIAAVISYLLRASPPARLLVVGLVIALSSTAIVIKELTRRNQADAPHGRLAVGVLLLQDLIVIAVLVLSPAIFGQASGGPGFVAILLRLVVVLLGVFFVGRIALPWLLRVVSSTGREAFSVSVLLASVGTAYLTAALGLSMSVGAFLAGLVLAESEFSHQIHSEVRPLRDLLASLFFISVGMLVEPAQLLAVAPAMLALSVAIVSVKSVAATLSLLIAGTPFRVALTTGVVLSQVGEFSLVLGRSAVESGTLGVADWQMLLGAAVLTMMVTPALVGAAPGLGVRVSRSRGARTGADEPVAHENLRDHVVILGYGMGGRLMARALSDLATPYIILELNGATVASARAAGEPIRFADVTAVDSLAAAGVASAAVVVGVLSDTDASERAVRAIRSLSAGVPIVMRTRYRLEAERLRRAGATLAVAEELEASLEVLAQLLSRLHIPGNIADVLLDAYRETTAAQTKRPLRARPVTLGELPSSINAAPVATHRLVSSAWAVGRTLGEVDLRAQTGVTVMAIRRQGRTVSSPGAEFKLETGDDIYMLGDDAEVRLARARLMGSIATP